MKNFNLKTKGLEVRTGHSTGSTNHREWQSDHGEPWTVLIVPVGTKEIVHVSESSRQVTITFSDGSEAELDDNVIFAGETLEEAISNVR